ncbi:GntR family transcriptional regulator [Nocardia jiangxiensis]|uniref:GntR family transcriptional regulator n=1 Tax=Nocardia jiangxiensis TaxID=282685 RepID=A0ABW6RVD4_9NOCA|nr:GntR family transcriptional regulator [Nocardia jiangxiensis]
MVEVRRRRAVSLTDEIASTLRERIYSQHYPPGTWLRQEQLSEELQVSRTPLREAFRSLERDGLVHVVAGQGARVVSGDIETLIAAYELRAVVDGLAARLASAAPTTRSVGALRTLIEQQQDIIEHWDPRTYTELNVAFHEQIMYMSGNDFVIGQMAILRLTAQVFARPHELMGLDAAMRAVHEHDEIAGAIAAGAGEEAERLARLHIQHTIADFRARYPSRPDSSGPHR